MRLFIGGDFAPTKFNMEDFRRGDGTKLYTDELMAYLDSFDYRIYDFECVFEGCGEPIAKYGPFLSAPEETMPGILRAKPDLMALANNHAGNLGEEGVLHTVGIFEKYGIACVGAGTAADAGKPYVIEKEGLRVGVYACAEHEFTYAADGKGGVNAYDPLETFDAIRELKASCDAVIVLYHGGILDWRYPSPMERRVLRKMADCGADLVVGQHTHCIGCMEEYHGSTIVYGQGDFLFARPTRNDLRYSGLLIEAEVTGSGVQVSFNVRVKPQDTIRLADPEEKEQILKDFRERSEQIQRERFLEANFERYVDKRAAGFNSALAGSSMAGKVLNRLSGRRYKNQWIDGHMSEEDVLKLVNFLDCETHRETFLHYLKRKAER